MDIDEVKGIAQVYMSMQEKAKYPHMMYDPKTGKEVEAKTPEDHEKLAALMASKVPKDNAQAVYAFVHNVFNELFTGDVCELAKPIVDEIDVHVLEKRTLKSSMKAEAEAKARDAKLKAEAEARMNAAPKGGDMLDMMDNVGEYSEEEDEDGYDFM